MDPRKVVKVLLLTGALLAGLLLALRLDEPVEPVAGFVLPQPQPLPEFSLVDQSGNAVTADTFRGRWHLVFFGFTNCPDICPATLMTLSTATSKLRELGHSTVPRMVLVSVDPERDTPEQIGRYVDYFGAGNLGVTGDLGELQKLTSALGIYFEKQPGDADYAVDHSAAVLLLDPLARLHALFSGPHVVDDYVHDIPVLTREH